MLERIINRLWGWKKVNLPESEDDILSRYIDIVNEQGKDSQEAKNYFKAVRRQYPQTAPLLRTAYDLKCEYEAGRLD